mmetsp:Transcript_105788/g.210220  ORF Transcript_105788/g.210220 Transcript_105788/m.210220 type:complete len:289 (+) Transcript_105788:52-918(+)
MAAEVPRVDLAAAKVPRVDLATVKAPSVAAAETGAAAAGVTTPPHAGSPAGRNHVQQFKDFWEDTEEGQKGGAHGPPKDGEKFTISSPRLQIFRVATPRKHARAVLEEHDLAMNYTPEWPYSSEPPFCYAPTTLQLENMPPNVNVEVIVSKLNEWGFEDKFNFIHVPMKDATNRVGEGWGLVNALRHADATAMAGRLHQYTDWPGIEGQGDCPPCQVTWSMTCQGADALVWAHQQDQGVWHADGTYTGAWVRWGTSWSPVVQPTFCYYPMVMDPPDPAAQPVAGVQIC